MIVHTYFDGLHNLMGCGYLSAGNHCWMVTVGQLLIRIQALTETWESLQLETMCAICK